MWLLLITLASVTCTYIYSIMYKSVKLYNCHLLIGVNISSIVFSPNFEYFDRVSALILKTDSGLLYPFVRNTLNSPYGNKT